MFRQKLGVIAGLKYCHNNQPHLWLPWGMKVSAQGRRPKAQQTSHDRVYVCVCVSHTMCAQGMAEEDGLRGTYDQF